MSTAKIAISIDRETLKKLDRLVREGFFPSRSKAIQDAVQRRLRKLDHGCLDRECAKLNAQEEVGLAEEGMSLEISQWPEY